MVKVTFVQPGGESVTIDAVVGDTVMGTATANDVDGIVGDCGGGMICGTCHVFVQDEWQGAVGPHEGVESEVLEGTAVEAEPNSRLSCQIVIDSQLDGLVVSIPEAQW